MPPKPDRVQVRCFGPPRLEPSSTPLGPKPSTVLALLASAGADGQTTDALIEATWSGNPPATARKSIHKYVSQLRDHLGDALVSTENGYRLDGHAVAIDVVEFTNLLSQSGAPPDLASLDRAIGLRAGVPYEGLDDIAPLALERRRLDELWLSALERRLLLWLDIGRLDAVIADGEGLIGEHPFREGLWRSLMLALHQSGRSPEALQAFGRYRSLLGDELGLEPSAELQDLEEQILLRDPAITRTTRRLGNLPEPLTSFVGRTSDVASLRSTLQIDRLVTLIGPGGSGKTRLAIETARDVPTIARDGTWLVELAPLTDGARIGATIGTAIGLLEQDEPISETLVDHLGSRHVLLVVDNCEHLIDEVAVEVAMLLRRCPEMRMLATSREPLGIEGERLFEVAPLAVPDHDIDPSQLVEFGSTRLLLDRASTAAPSLTVDPAHTADIVGICARLDGIPLAIELAAARLRSLSPGQLLEMLDDRFNVLYAERRDVLPRQQTLEATIDWSYQLLTAAERTVFGRLSVFPNSFDHDAAEAITGYDLSGDRKLSQLLGSLVDKSMVQVERPIGAARFSLLETLRAFGSARLGDEVTEIRRRHAEYYAGLVSGSPLPGYRRMSPEQFAALARDYDNVRGALTYFMEHQPLRGLRMATGLERFWDAFGHRIEAQGWIDRALELTDPTDVEDRIRGLLASSYLHQSADLQRATDTAHEALSLADELNNVELIAASKLTAGWAHGIRSESEQGAQLIAEALEVFEAAGDRAAIAECLFAMGTVDTSPTGEAHLGKSVQIFRELNDHHHLANALYHLGAIYRASGRLHEAREVLQESLSISEKNHSRHDTAHARSELGQIARLGGNLDEARVILAESLEEMRDIGDRRCSARMTAALAWIATADGDLREAAALLKEALDMSVTVEAMRNTILCVETAGLLANQLGWDDDAVLLLAAAADLQRGYGIPIVAEEQALVQAALSTLPAMEGQPTLSLALAVERASSVAARAAHSSST